MISEEGRFMENSYRIQLRSSDRLWLLKQYDYSEIILEIN